MSVVLLALETKQIDPWSQFEFLGKVRFLLLCLSVVGRHLGSHHLYDWSCHRFSCQEIFPGQSDQAHWFSATSMKFLAGLLLDDASVTEPSRHLLDLLVGVLNGQDSGIQSMSMRSQSFAGWPSFFCTILLSRHIHVSFTFVAVAYFWEQRHKY